MIVFLSPHADSFTGFLGDYEITVRKYMPALVIPLSCLYPDHQRPNNLFLYYAALEALKLPELARARRVVVHDSLGVLWYDDLFKYIPETGRDTVYASSLSSLSPLRFSSTSCPGSTMIRASGSGGALFSSDTHFFAGVIAASSSMAMQHVLSKVGESTKNYTACSYQDGLNTYLLGLTSAEPRVAIEAWRSDLGPVSHHDSPVCQRLVTLKDAALLDNTTKGPLASLCNTRNVAVLTYRCQSVDREP